MRNSATVTDRLRRIQLKVLADNARIDVPGAMIWMAVIGFTLSGWVPDLGVARPGAFSEWYSLVAVWGAGSALFLIAYYVIDIDHRKLQYWMVGFCLLYACYGSLWGVATWYLWDSAVPANHLFFVVIALGVINTAIYNQSSLFLTFVSVVLTSVGLLWLRYLTDPDAAGQAAFLLLLPMFAAWMLMIAYRAYRRQIETLRLRFEKEELARELAGAHDDAVAARQRAEDANRAKSEFLAVITHEIRTPLNAILGLAGVLRRADLPPREGEQVRLVQKSGEQLMLLLNDVLDLSKIEAGRLELEITPFSPAALINDIAELWSVKAREKNIAFKVDMAPGLPPRLMGDPSRLQQVLYNLVSNALKFTETGYVRVAARSGEPRDGHVPLVIEVEDTGIGIDAAAQARLFESFTQADASTARRFGGTGLGLSICRKLTDLMGGTLSLDSRPGEGTTFRLELALKPADKEERADEPSDKEIGLHAPDRPLRILVADDNHINQTVVRAMLEPFDHHIDVVGNGLEAIENLKRLPYDVVLMDVNMPEMDGVTATRHIRSQQGQLSRLPIVALTANAMRDDLRSYIEAGMNACVTKPIDVHHLLRTLDAVTRRGRAADTASDGPETKQASA